MLLPFLLVAIAMKSPPAVAGNTVYDNVVTVTNNGPGAVANPIVRIDYDRQVAKMPKAPKGWICSAYPAYAFCMTASFAPGVATFTFPVPAPVGIGTIVQTASVTVAKATKQVTTKTAVQAAQADLRLTNMTIPASLQPGTTGSVVVDFVNGGPSSAFNLKLTLSVPPGAMYQAYSAPAPIRCTEPPRGGAGNLVCTAGGFGTGAGEVSMVVQVDPAATPGTSIPFSATLASTNAIKPVQTLSRSVAVQPK